MKRVGMQKLLALSVLLAISPLKAQDNLNQRGIFAFNNGDYETALEIFEEIEANGNATESTQYNIAVSLYRLGRYEDSRRRFVELQDEPQWRELVNYNLGLVMEAMGEEDRALSYYRSAADQSQHEKIRSLARLKIDSLNQDDTRQQTPVAGVQIQNDVAKDWAALVKLSGGVNSNATSLADDLIDETSNTEDTFAEILLYGHKYLIGNQRDGLRLYGLAFDRAYEEFRYLDSRIAGVGMVYEKPFAGFDTEMGVRYTQTRLVSETVANQLQLNLGISKRLSVGTFSLDYFASDFDAGKSFQQIDGTQQRIEVDWSKRWNDVNFRLRYRHETNDREDLSRGAAFASYSPDRDSLRGEFRWQISNRVSSKLYYEITDSDYQQTNTLRDSDGTVRSQIRENEKQQAGVTFNYQINSHWRLSADVRHTDADDNYKLYSYDQKVAAIGIEWQP